MREKSGGNKPKRTPEGMTILLKMARHLIFSASRRKEPASRGRYQELEATR